MNWNLFSSIIPSVSTIFSLYVVYALYKERKEKSRPYIQVSNELVRSSVACIIFRNTGECLAEIKSIRINDKFISESITYLEKQENIINLKKTSITIAPNQKWILSLDCLIGALKNKVAIITITYIKYGKRKQYTEIVEINFDNIGAFLIYQSELDEINKSLKEIIKEMKAGLMGKIIDAVRSKKYDDINTHIMDLQNQILLLQPVLFELQQENQNLRDEIKLL